MIAQEGVDEAGNAASYCRDCWGSYDRTNQMENLCRLLSSTRNPVPLVTLFRRSPAVVAEVSVAVFGRSGPFITPLPERQSVTCVLS
jgi:hypothetical protein